MDNTKYTVHSFLRIIFPRHITHWRRFLSQWRMRKAQNLRRMSLNLEV